jgi:tetratricopeptide (TPR) repeat protein
VEAGLKLTGAPERERAYLGAVATWCPEYKPDAYIEAMRAVAARYPDDLDAATIFAESIMIRARWHWYAADGTPAAGMGEAERVLQRVLQRWPDHPGANHYYIHAVESSPDPERAIPSAQRLMGLVPQAGHLVHMPGHIWLVLGDWETAATVNERAAQVDREYFAASNVVGGTYMPYYVHNLHFILFARSMQGRRAETLAAAAAMSEAMAPMAQAMPEMADSFLPIPMLARVRFGDWESLLKMAPPPDSMKVTSAMWRYSRATALTARGDRSGAAAERDAFEKLKSSIPADAPWGQNKTGDVLAMVSEVLAARGAASPADAVPHWRRAVEMQDALTYDEPPDWYYPLRESLGAAVLRAGDAAEAERVFREGVRRSPRNGRMLFGLMESLNAQHRTEDAAWVRREFEAAWAKADVKLRIEEM